MFLLAMSANPAQAEAGSGAEKFAQLGSTLATPNVYRNAAGAPGPDYWQQSVDYKIQIRLDESSRSLHGSETITYKNHSPDSLAYLWIQLDQNRFEEDSIDHLTSTSKEDRLSFNKLRQIQSYEDNSHGIHITKVTDSKGKPLSHKINGTMMRIDLPKRLKPGTSTSLKIEWHYNIIEQAAVGGRAGYERFKSETDEKSKGDTYIYFLAQWFPRLAAYTDYTGWQHKQFLGRGEFTLEFGNYDVEITVPADHIVSSTGALQNPTQVLTAEQRRRLKSAGTDKPTFIVTPEEALENESSGTAESKTWHFKAEQVRDFAWSSSRKFIWDAMLHEQPGAKHEKVLAMSFYPKEAEPIWSHYSTHAVVHTMDVYSRFSFDYPYPTAQSVNTWAFSGMEYPMITFNGYRPTPPEEKDEDDDAANNAPESDQATTDDDHDKPPTYSRSIKYGLIGVIIHEVGHIYFPMVVNSDERQWTWMDEGLNSFLEYLAEQEWEERFPAYRKDNNVLDYIPKYMTSSHQVPIMTNSESILQFGPNAYSKPTAALTVLRETVMGRELFDFAFKEYAERWMFKRPTPADFFRTMEDASAVDLDWFWRGWFYTTDHVDLAITGIRAYRVLSKDPDVDAPLKRDDWHRDHPDLLGEERNRASGLTTRIVRYPELKDIYNEMDRFSVTNKDRNGYTSYLDELEDWEVSSLARVLKQNPYVYFVDFENKGGLVSPLPLRIKYEDGETREVMIPAEIWRRDADKVTKLFYETKPISSISIDNKHQTADADFSNNQFPPAIITSRFELFKRDKKGRDLMADLLVKLKSEKGGDKEDSSSVPLTPANQQ